MKHHVLTALREQFGRWEALLGGMTDEQITAAQLADSWSIKDVIAHLWSWQQRSIARLEAAAHGREPEYPRWPAEFDPEQAGQPHQLNAWLYAANQDKPWPQVRREWSEGFRRFLELGEVISEQDLLDGERYTWMEGHPLILVLLGSYDHHREHFDVLLAWMQEHGHMKSAAT